MNQQTSLDEWPIIDPDRDLIGIPGASGSVHSAARRVCQARARMAGQMAAETTLTQYQVDSFFLPALSALHAPVEQQMRRRILIVFGCLEHIVRTYPHDQELQDYLDVPLTMRQWVLRAPEDLRRVDLCRLDLLGERLGALRILEFNANSPGGIIIDGLLSRLWRQVPDIADLLCDWDVATAPFEQRDWFIQLLLAVGASHGIADSETRKIAVLHKPQGDDFALALMKRHILRSRRIPVLLNPTTTPVPEDLRLGYLKYRPRDILRDVGHWDGFCARVGSGRLVIPNPFAGRFVAESKLCLAVMSDPRFRRLFSASQHQALDALVPWSRKLGDGISIADAIANRQELVLKAPYDSAGWTVYLGRQHNHEDWSALLRDPSRRGWLIQQYLPAPRIDTAQGPRYRDLCVWIVNGDIAGYLSRVSQNRRANVAQGGAIQAIFGNHPP